MLGQSKAVDDMHPDWTGPPQGYDSVRSVPGMDFEDNEYVVYRADQQAMVYLLEVELKSAATCYALPAAPVPGQFVSQHLGPAAAADAFQEPKPAKLGQVGLICDGGVSAPLQGVHVKARLVDLVGEVCLAACVAAYLPACPAGDLPCGACAVGTSPPMEWTCHALHIESGP